MNGSFRGLPLAIPRVAAAFGTHPVCLRDSDAIDQNDRARNNLYWRKRPRIQMQFQQTRCPWRAACFPVVKLIVVCCSYTKLGYAGNTEPQFIIPSCEYFASYVFKPIPPTGLCKCLTLFHFSNVFSHKMHQILSVYFLSLFNSLFSRQVSPSKSRPRSGTRPSVGWWRGWMIWTSTSEMKP